MTAEVALRDPLTGAHSRATLQDRLREEVERARRYGLSLSLLILDLDHFKTINDAFGHTRGDLVLIGFVERLRSLTRDSDLLFRYGGDEFVLLLLHTDRTHTLAFAQRLLEGIRGTPFPGNPALTLTLSIGAASYPEDGHNAEDLFERADRRLFEAKRHGRARVVTDDPLAPGRMSFEAGSRLVDREIPLARLRQFLDELTEHKRGVFSVTGPPGVGKTWFLSEIAKSARLRGYAVWSVPARPALRGRVYGALAEATPPLPGLPALGAGDKAFVRAVQQALDEQGMAGLLLAVDDLAELDRASFELLWRLLFAPELGVVALAYSAEPNSPNRAPPFETKLQASVELRPLTVLGVRLWLRTVLRWEPPEAATEWLHRETGGLPGAIQRALVYLVEREVLQPQEPGWTLAADYERLPLAATLQQLLRPPPHNLPTPITAFVGREAELGALKHQIATEPLLTVVGPGGMGKTRLALQAAAELRKQFPDGVFLVSLVAVTTADDLVSAIAHALNLPFAGSSKARRQLVNHLAERELLLVLDDFEYLLDAAALLADIRQQAPRVKLLITSRERLNLPEEAVFELRGFPLPAAGNGALRTGQRADGDFGAEQLFLQSARRAMPDFSLHDDDRLYVRRICELVEGMPLGIELAAAWTPLFTCREIANQIERSLDFLTTGRAEIPERQRSARAVLDYFWGLLSEDERRRVRGLSVFRSGFTLEAAQQMAEASLFFLSALVDKAFLRKAANGRYEMQELLRQYAEARLRELPDEHLAASDRHSDYYAGFLAHWLPALKGGQQAQALAAISADIANVRVAWRWATTHGRIDTVLRSAPGLILFYEMQHWFHEGAEVLARALEVWRGLPPAGGAHDIVFGQLLAGQGAFLHRLGLNARARRALAESLERFRAAGDPQPESEQARVQLYLGQVLVDLGEYEAARCALDESLALHRAVGDGHGAAMTLEHLASAAFAVGDYATAQSVCAESLHLRRDHGDSHGMARSLGLASAIALDLGDLARAQTWLDESNRLIGALGQAAAAAPGHRLAGRLAAARSDLEAARRSFEATLAFSQETGNRNEIAQDLLGMADLAAQSGELDEAERRYEQCLSLFRETGHRRGESLALTGLGLAAAARHDEASATRHLAEALRAALVIGALPPALDALVGIGALWVHAGRHLPAAELLTFALYHPSSTRHTQAAAGRVLSRLEAEVPAAEIAAAEDRGRRAELAQMVAAALP